jgi:UMP-CMP kinase
MINNYIAEGKIVPAEVTINLLKQAMTRSHRRRFLIDGFPRNLENYNAWKQVRAEPSRLAYTRVAVVQL